MQVVNRNIFGGSFVWVEELAGMCMVGITFLGAALATSTNAHTRIDFIILKLPKRGTKIMYMLGNAVCAAFVCSTPTSRPTASARKTSWTCSSCVWTPSSC